MIGQHVSKLCKFKVRMKLIPKPLPLEDYEIEVESDDEKGASITAKIMYEFEKSSEYSGISNMYIDKICNICKYINYMGNCGVCIDDDERYCQIHKKTKCGVDLCNKKSYGDCKEGMTLICGTPLCKTHFTRGHNCGAK